MRAQGRRNGVDLHAQRRIAGGIRELEFEQPGSPHAELGIGWIRNPEVVAVHFEGHLPNQRINNFEPPVGVGDDALRQLLDRGGKTIWDVVEQDDAAHGGGVATIVRRDAHAQEEGLTAHDDVELLAVGDPECRIVEQDFAHVVISRDRHHVAEVRNWPHGAKNSQHEG